MRPVLIASTLLLIASPAFAQEVEEDWYVVTDTAAPAGCTPESARPISFAEVMSGSLEGPALECVTVEGLWAVTAFHDGKEGFYADRGSSWMPSSTRLGVYGWRDRIDPPDRPTPARLTGRIGDCEQFGGPDVMMVMGYCHYVRGRFIALGQATADGAAAERLTGPAHRVRLGDLLEIDPSSPLHATVEARGREWLNQLRAGDARAYALAYGDQHQLEFIDDPESDFHALFRDERSIFGRLRGEDQADLRLWRIADEPLDPEDEPRDPSDYAVLACFRIGQWTDDRWPVAGVDADNNAERPYACVDLWRETRNGETREGLDAGVGSSGLAEPARW